MRWNQRVRFRAPLAVVDAVENAGEHRGAGAQRSIQTENILRRLNLAGIGGADGTERVGKLDAALDVADIAEELHAAGPVDAGIERQRGQYGLGKQTLIPKSVLRSEEHTSELQSPCTLV